MIAAAVLGLLTLFIFLAVLLVLLGQTPRNNPLNSACIQDSDCESGLACDTTLHLCKRIDRQPCTIGADCITGLVCQSGVCQMPQGEVGGLAPCKPGLEEVRGRCVIAGSEPAGLVTTGSGPMATNSSPMMLNVGTKAFDPPLPLPHWVSLFRQRYLLTLHPDEQVVKVIDLHDGVRFERAIPLRPGELGGLASSKLYPYLLLQGQLYRVEAEDSNHFELKRMKFVSDPIKHITNTLDGRLVVTTPTRYQIWNDERLLENIPIMSPVSRVEIDINDEAHLMTDKGVHQSHKFHPGFFQLVFNDDGRVGRVARSHVICAAPGCCIGVETWREMVRY